MKDFYFYITDQMDLNALKTLVDECDHDVYYESRDGDKIALKSTLGQFIFFSLNDALDIIPQDSWIHCVGVSDHKRLSQLLTPCTRKR